MKVFQTLYLRVFGWAQHQHAPRYLAVLSFTESSFFPIPPDILLIPLALGRREKALHFGLICSVCSILGAALGYGIGLWVWWAEPNVFTSFAQFFFDHIPGFTYESFENIKSLYDEYNFLIIFSAGFTPIPFKLFTISAGAFNIQFPMFIFAKIINFGDFSNSNNVLKRPYNAQKSLKKLPELS